MKPTHTYSNAIQQILTEYAEYMTTDDDVLQIETLFDTKRHHYQIVVLGWQNNKRIYHNLIHLDIINGQIWVQNNNTQFTLIEDFDRLNIPRKALVNGLISARRRQFRDYELA
jgi:hypothetical protein